jgi:hypothetical protein
MILNIYFRIFLLLFLSITLNGCGENSFFNLDKGKELIKVEELNAIDEFVKKQKGKLPVQVDFYTVWVDIKFVDNKIVYVYMISSNKISNQQIDAMRKYYYSDPKKSELCKAIKGLLNIKIIYEYMYINVKGEELATIPFDEKMCLKIK